MFPLPVDLGRRDLVQRLQRIALHVRSRNSGAQQRAQAHHVLAEGRHACMGMCIHILLCIFIYRIYASCMCVLGGVEGGEGNPNQPYGSNHPRG